MTDKRHPDPHKGGGDQYKRHVDGDIKVSGQVEVHSPPDIAKADSADREHQRSHLDKTYVISVLTLIGVVVYAGLTACQVHFAKKSSEAAEKAASIAQTSSQRALQASIDASRVDQRAWVSLLPPVDTVDHKQIRANTPFSLKLRFKNTGKTPALRISYDPIIVIKPITETYPDYDTEQTGKTSYEQLGISESALIAPGEEVPIYYPGIVVNEKPTVLSPDVVKAINTHKQIMYIIGKVTYHDIFVDTPERHTKFCLSYVPSNGTEGFAACPKNRTMD